VLKRIAEYKNYRENVLIEQPIRSQDIEDLADITAHSPIPIIADDAVCTKEQCLEVIRKEAAHIVKIKITKAGGFHPAKQLIGICEAAGMPYIIDEITETRVCGTAVSHLALTVSKMVYGGCTCHAHLSQDTVKDGGLKITNGQVSIPDVPGLGLVLNEEIIRYEA
jgi:L-alanine-DL-glutamate epimerase-like enolase superfamily enzyme